MARTNRPKKIIKIGSAFVAAPSSFKEAPYDIWQPDTGRDLTGLMHGAIVTKKRKWNASWKALSEAEAKALINALMTARSGGDGWFNIIMNSMEPGGISGTGTEGQTATYTVYLGDREYSYQWWSDSAGQYLTDFSCSFIER